jgi:hypothetical protein
MRSVRGGMPGVHPGPLRLSDAGDAKPAWITLLTTEHYNLQTERAATISEVNGRASVFLGAVSAGLIAAGLSRHPLSAGSVAQGTARPVETSHSVRGRESRARGPSS